MTNRLSSRNWSRARTGAIVAGALVALLGGCKKPPPPPKPAPPPPPPPRQPDPVDVAALLQSMSVDERVEFAEDAAPVSRGLAEAVITLADSIARGDAEAMRGLLAQRDQGLLDQLVNSEQWYEATEGIEAVRVVSMDSIGRLSEEPEEAELAIAVQDPDGAYVLVWSASMLQGDWVFSAEPSTAQEQARATSFDGMSPEQLAETGADAASLFAGIDSAVLAQLAQFGIDPTNPDPMRLQAFLDEYGERLPPEVMERLRELLATLGGGQPETGGDEGGDAGGGAGRTGGG